MYLYFKFMHFNLLLEFLDAFDWETNDVDIVIRKEPKSWIVCLKEKDDK